MKITCSTVITSYNRKYCIGRAIESTLREFPDQEIVIVDDASTDGTVPWIYKRYEKEISSGLILIELLSENIGVTGAKNIGYKKANGKWVFFLDSDDYYEFNVGKEILAELKKSSCYPILFFRCRTVDGKFIGSNMNTSFDIDLKKYLKEGSYGEALSAFNKNRIGANPPYIQNLRGYEGLGCARLIKRNGPAKLSKIIARVYVLEGKDRLSNWRLFVGRMYLISIGHVQMINEFRAEMSFFQAFILRCKSIIYFTVGKLFMIYSRKNKC